MLTQSEVIIGYRVHFSCTHQTPTGVLGLQSDPADCLWACNDGSYDINGDV